ncbi:MAG TPA: cytochrome c [Chitinophagaceae bacterium]|nr:cytochrome c [Chitinophagaceae bacterium]
MKKLLVFTFLSAGVVLVSCGGDIRREQGRIYMPDMAYSRAYETYAERDSTVFTTDPNNPGDKIFYNNLPVAGTIARGEEMPFPIAKDKPGDTTNYVAARAIPSPITTLSSADSTEAARLYLVNCGICHGPNLDGNGPLWKGGDGPFPSKPKDLLGDPIVSVMPEGQMFYSVTYGKNLMGSYASQLNRKQRWMVIHYIKQLQLAKKAQAAPAATAGSTAK